MSQPTPQPGPQSGPRAAHMTEPPATVARLQTTVSRLSGKNEQLSQACLLYTSRCV